MIMYWKLICRALSQNISSKIHHMNIVYFLEKPHDYQMVPTLEGERW